MTSSPGWKWRIARPLSAGAGKRTLSPLASPALIG
jgi:hypothetical protein